MTSRKRTVRRTGFSLLEVILAVALSAVVIYLVAGAIDFHLRQLTVRRTRIEEAQVARAILRRISDDLRAVVVDRPIDLSSVNQLVQATLGGNEDDEGGSGEAASAEDAEDDTSSATSIVNAGLLPETPGVYGNAYELQVDISRIPRYEEYAVVDQSTDLQALRLLSDVKTVSYFLLGTSGFGGTSRQTADLMNSNQTDYLMLGLPPGQPLQGLGRRTLDRAATRYATGNADFSFLDEQTELFAPEVALIQFRYFDGLQWLTQWDTEQFGGIPLAIEITLVLEARDAREPEELRSTRQATTQETLWQFDPDHVYRLVVNLPAAEPIDTTALLEEEGTTTDEEGASR